MFGCYRARRYMMLKKSTLAIAAIAAMGIAGAFIYRHHRKAIKNAAIQITDDIGDVAKKGVDVAKEVVDEIKK